jgi:hypothetical protein
MRLHGHYMSQGRNCEVGAGLGRVYAFSPPVNLRIIEWDRILRMDRMDRMRREENDQKMSGSSGKS